MLVAHLGTGHNVMGGGWGEQWMWIFDGRSSALFATLAGVSIALMSRSATTKVLVRALRVKLLVRAAIILAIGLILQFMGTPIAVILPSYAVMFIMAMPLLRLPTKWLLTVGGTALILGPVVVLGLRNATTGQVTPYDHNFLFGIGEMVWGYYPALIWIGFIAVGMAMGRGNLASRGYAAALTLGGAALAAVAYGGATLLTSALANAGTATDRYFWPDVLLSTEPHSSSPFEVVGNLGVALAVTGICLLLTSARAGAAILSPLAATGAMSLTIYSAQIVVIAVLGEAAVYYPTSNTPLLVLTFASIAFAVIWKQFLGQGPLERLLKVASDAAARGVVRRGTPPPGWQ